MADVVLEEEERDAQEGLSMMEDEVYFVEDLTEREHPSIQGVALEESREEENEDEEEWDAEGGSFIEDLEKSGEEEDDKEEEWNDEGGFFMEDLEESGEEENDEEECDIENGFSTEEKIFTRSFPVNMRRYEYFRSLESILENCSGIYHMVLYKYK
ncbi:hypothetical protein BRADI_3g54564v3 [Brachypodium distachyon]|uniref:Uncharacterized protein n=1 Tax=Brachypodium distachyon TaxID=15368 RepID=A0A2K2D535_BRADI|nr:hypothetical protein BRADI_3g54564v3 [Brachypodium distachyon]